MVKDKFKLKKAVVHRKVFKKEKQLTVKLQTEKEIKKPIPKRIFFSKDF